MMGQLFTDILYQSKKLYCSPKFFTDKNDDIVTGFRTDIIHRGI